MLTCNFEFIKKNNNKEKKKTSFLRLISLLKGLCFPICGGKKTWGPLYGHHAPSGIMRRRYYYNIRNV